MKKAKLLVILLSVAVFSGNRVFAYFSAIGEECLFHLDKDFYTTGETIWFKIYLPKSFEEFDLAFELKVVNHEGNQISSFWLKNDQKSHLTSHFDVPHTLSSGKYHLILVGRYKDGSPVTISHISVPIYNDLEENGSFTNSDLTVKIEKFRSTTYKALDVEVELDKGIFSKRGLIKGKVVIRDEDGSLIKGEASISVTDIQVLDKKSKGSNYLFSPFHSKIEPEELGDKILLTGAVTSKDGKDINSSPLTYFSTIEQKLNYSRTLRPGFFSIPLGDYYGSKQIQLQDYLESDLNFSILKKFETEIKESIASSNLVRNYLKLSRERKKIYQYFSNPIKASRIENPSVDINEWDGGKRMDLAKYERFKDLPSFCLEVKNPLGFKLGKDGKYKSDFFVNRYGDLEAKSGPALFIIDGKLTRNANFIARIDINNISHFDLFYDYKKLLKQFGPIGMNGVAVLKTKSGFTRLPEHEEANIFDVYGFQRQREFKLTEEKTTPLFSPLINWQAELISNSEKIIEFEFPHSDDIGKFQIEVIVQAEDGSMGYATLIYQVQE